MMAVALHEAMEVLYWAMCLVHQTGDMVIKITIVFVVFYHIVNNRAASYT